MAAPKGNKNAQKAKDWERELRTALHHFESEKVQKGQALAKIAKNVVAQAVEGDWKAIEEIANRLDGKHAQSVDISGLIEHRDITDITDDQLADIATGRSSGTTEPQAGETEPSSVH